MQINFIQQYKIPGHLRTSGMNERLVVSDGQVWGNGSFNVVIILPQHMNSNCWEKKQLWGYIEKCYQAYINLASKRHLFYLFVWTPHAFLCVALGLFLRGGMLYTFDCAKYTYLLPPELPDGQSIVTIGHCSKTESQLLSSC